LSDYVLTKDQNDPNAPRELWRVTTVQVQPVDHLCLLTIQEADGTT